MLTAQLQQAADLMCKKFDILYKKAIKNNRIFNLNCYKHPSHTMISLTEVPRSEWEQYVVLLTSNSLVRTIFARVAWWEVKSVMRILPESYGLVKTHGF